MGTTSGKEKKSTKDTSHKGEPIELNTTEGEALEQSLEPAVTEADMPTANTGDDNAGEGNTLKLQGEIDRLKVLLETAHDNVLRARADAENAQNRATKDKLDGIMFANKAILVDLLPVIDNLELALAHLKTHNATSADNAPDNATSADNAPEQSDEGTKSNISSFADGVAITLKQLVTTLAKHGVEPIETPIGTPFDPNFHEGLMLELNPELDDNTVSGTLQTGYTLNGRVVRPAKVKVSKK